MSNTSTLLVVGAPIAIVGALIGTLLLIVMPATARPCSVEAASTVDPANLLVEEVGDYGTDQLRNAALVMNAAQAMGLGHNAQVAGVMAAIGESNLTITPVATDRAGLFGQPSGRQWGTESDRLDPTISATRFYTALTAIPEWETMYPTVAISRVTGAPDPYYYGSFQLDAYDIIAGISGQNGSCLAGDLVYPLDAGYIMTDDYGPRNPPVSLPGFYSVWHPAADLQHLPNPCGDQIYAITEGTVTYAAGYQLSVKHPDGYTVSYLHMSPRDMLVDVGDEIQPNDVIALVGAAGPATGCHLDLRINTVGAINETVAALPLSESIGGGDYPGFVDPEEFYALFGLELCPATTCVRTYQ